MRWRRGRGGGGGGGAHLPGEGGQEGAAPAELQAVQADEPVGRGDDLGHQGHLGGGGGGRERGERGRGRGGDQYLDININIKILVTNRVFQKGYLKKKKNRETRHVNI